MTRIATMLLTALTLLVTPALAQNDPTDPHQPTGPNAALFEAAKTGSLEGIRAAVEAGADVNWFDDFGTTPLMLAAANATDPAVIQYLVDEAGARVFYKDALSMMAIHHAALSERNNPEVVRELIRKYAQRPEWGTPAHEPHSQGYTPIIFAAAAGRPDEVLQELEYGAFQKDLNRRGSDDGKTALMIYATKPNAQEQIRTLVLWGEDPNLRNDFERMSRPDGEGLTAPMYAAKGKYPENLLGFCFVEEEGVRYQLEFDPDIRCDRGKTVLDYARENAAFINSGLMDQFEQGVLNARLWKAAREGTPEEIKALVEAGADIEARSYHDEETALIFAVRHNPDPDVTGTLLELGAKIQPAEWFYDNAAEVAGAEAKNIKVVQRVLDGSERTEQVFGLLQDALENAIRADRNWEFIEPILTRCKARVPEGRIADWSTNMLMRAAARSSSVELIKALLAEGADPNATQPKSLGTDGVRFLSDRELPSLYLAAGSNPNPDVLRLLIRAGADPTFSNEDGYSVLFRAVGRTDPEFLQVLIELPGFDVTDPQTAGTGNLFRALHPRDAPLSIALELLDRGADPNDTTDGLSHPMFWATHNEEASRLLSLFLEHGADPNARAGDDEYYYSILHRIVSESSPAAVRVLLEAGADPDQTDSDGLTALHAAAAYSEHSETIKLLLEHGASIEARTNRADTPLHYAASSRYPANLIMLLDAGADPAARDDQGQTPLDIAEDNYFFYRTKELKRLRQATQSKPGN